MRLFKSRPTVDDIVSDIAGKAVQLGAAADYHQQKASFHAAESEDHVRLAQHHGKEVIRANNVADKLLQLIS